MLGFPPTMKGFSATPLIFLNFPASFYPKISQKLPANAKFPAHQVPFFDVSGPWSRSAEL